jgi:aspartyl-tRNA(Asn)/glutamyl-tRNA(Gln) amidotransferase subunit A
MLECLPASHDFGPRRRAAVAPEIQHHQMPQPPRLGTLAGFWQQTADENIRQATQTALDKLSAAGAAIVPVSADVDFSQVQPMHRRIMAVEAASVHRDDYRANPQAYGPLISRLLDEGLSTSAVDYAAALAWLRDYRRRVVCFFEGVDAIVVPSTHTTAPPTLTTLTGTSEFQAPWSAAGVPLVSVPCGLAADGLPAAVQIVGRYHDEPRLLAIARWCERVFAFDNVPPIAHGR